jgi:hypothetical protein
VVVEAVLQTSLKFLVPLAALVEVAGEIQAQAEMQLPIRVTQVETEQALEPAVVEVPALSVLMLLGETGPTVALA